MRTQGRSASWAGNGSGGSLREGVDAGDLQPPFLLTHIDAHADLGTGDAGWVPLMTEVLHRDPSERASDPWTESGVNDGTYLSFALACRWVSSLEFVHNGAGSDDVNVLHMKDYDLESSVLQLKAVTAEEYERIQLSFTELPTPSRLEPEIPFHQIGYSRFRAEAPYDVVCLCRSPGFTTVECDPIYDAVVENFIRPIG